MNAHFLSLVQRICARKENRRKLVKNCCMKKLNQLRNVCHHLCQGKYHIPEDLRRKLRKHKKDIRDFGDTRKLKSEEALKRRFVQKGGFFQWLLPAVIGLLTNLSSGLIERALPL